MQITLTRDEAISLKVALQNYIARALAEVDEREIRDGKKVGIAVHVHPDSCIGRAQRIHAALKDYQHGTHNPRINTKATVPA